MIPTELSNLINTAMEQVEQDPHHSFMPKDRLAMYRAIESLSPTGYARFSTALALLTARMVLPIWERDVPDDNFFQEILTASEDIAANKSTPEEIHEQHMRFYHTVGSGYYEEEVTGAAYYALSAVHTCFCITLGRKPFDEISPEQIEQGFPDEILSDVRADPVSWAVVVFSGPAYDDNFLLNKILVENHAAQLISDYKKTFFPGFDPSKRYDFWKQWLLEIVPQAWEQSQ